MKQRTDAISRQTPLAYIYKIEYPKKMRFKFYSYANLYRRSSVKRKRWFRYVAFEWLIMTSKSVFSHGLNSFPDGAMAMAMAIDPKFWIHSIENNDNNQKIDARCVMFADMLCSRWIEIIPKQHHYFNEV